MVKECKEKHIVADAKFYLGKEDHPRVEIALCWTDHTSERIRSFVNGIPTQDGGTHEQGLKDAVLRSVRGYIENNNVPIPRGIKLSAEDIREGLTAICSIFLIEPQFKAKPKTN